MKTNIKMAFLGALFFVAAPSWAGIVWHVDNEATGANDGTSWTDAYTNFTVAVSNVWGSGANTGATIYVRQAMGAPDYMSMGLEIGDGLVTAHRRLITVSSAGRERGMRNDRASCVRTKVR